MSAKSPKPSVGVAPAPAAPPLLELLPSPPTSRLNSATASSTLTSMAYSEAPASPSTLTTSPLERSTSSASPSECAGSVLTTSVL